MNNQANEIELRHGGMCSEPIDTEDEGIGYEVDEFSTEHRSPNMIVIGEGIFGNGGLQ